MKVFIAVNYLIYQRVNVDYESMGIAYVSVFIG